MTNTENDNGRSGKNNQAKPLFVAMLIDKSGSMSSLTQATVEGFNEYLGTQKREAPDTLMSVTLFDTTCDDLHVGSTLDRIPELTVERYTQGGMGNTALNDAIGRTVVAIDRGNYAAGRRVLVVVTTDGLENASQEWPDRRAIANIIKLKEQAGWKFVFFGTSINAFTEGASLNIPSARSVQYTKTSEGQRDLFRRLAPSAAAYAAGAPEAEWTAALQEPADLKDRS